ncbi:putative toxin-antitoxin system toxin component, PIN family [Methyloprofundus sp.]|uniref:putative toxin-antitoxin system toxin component, PIN family n=1 Tax=Methyloprofundus sp. TaxID=2020875 RepID=UPI003D10AE30
MKVVLDTNVLLVSIATKSRYRVIFDSLINNGITLIISNEILSEYTEIIERKTNMMIASNISEMLVSLPNVYKQEVYYRWGLIEEDKDDNKFVDCAIAGNVDYLVSNDQHFNCLKKIDFPKLNLLSIDEFMDLLNK